MNILHKLIFTFLLVFLIQESISMSDIHDERTDITLNPQITIHTPTRRGLIKYLELISKLKEQLAQAINDEETGNVIESKQWMETLKKILVAVEDLTND